MINKLSFGVKSQPLTLAQVKQLREGVVVNRYATPDELSGQPLELELTGEPVVLDDNRMGTLYGLPCLIPVYFYKDGHEFVGRVDKGGNTVKVGENPYYSFVGQS